MGFESWPPAPQQEKNNTPESLQGELNQALAESMAKVFADFVNKGLTPDQVNEMMRKAQEVKTYEWTNQKK